MSVLAYFFEPGVADQLSVGDLDDAIWFLGKADPGAPGAGEIRVRVHASSLNYHDFGVVMEQSEPDCKGNVGRRGSPDNGRRR